MTADDVRVEIYSRFIEEQRAPTTEEVAEASGLTVEGARDAIRALADEDIIALAPGTDEIWLAHPFCATPAPFRVTSGSEVWDGICIWDALGILALLERDGSVTTACPDCGSDLIVTVQGGRVRADPGVIVHYGVPAARWYEDVAYT